MPPSGYDQLTSISNAALSLLVNGTIDEFFLYSW